MSPGIISDSPGIISDIASFFGREQHDGAGTSIAYGTRKIHANDE